MEEKILTAEQMMEECAAHPEKQQIFTLEKMLREAEYPFWFNYRDDLRPTPFGEMSADDINWEEYNFLIEVGRLAGYNLAELSITFSTGKDKTKLEVLDMRGAKDNPEAKAEDGELTVDLTAEEAMEIIEKFFETV
ncbi:MAG: hypothetical protein IJL07_10355 [Lachnospiraceae bacterium]|nr:hypothetical protein [Lachnospiraceae bacterium]